MSHTAAHLVDRVIPRMPVRQWVLSLPISLRVLLAARPELVTPVLQVVQRVLTRHLLGPLRDAPLKGRCLSPRSNLCRIGFAANRRLLQIEQISHDCALGDDAFQHLQRPRQIEGQRAPALRFGDANAQAVLNAVLMFVFVARGFTNKVLGLHLLHRVQGELGRIQGDGAGALWGAALRGDDPGRADRREGRRQFQTQPRLLRLLHRPDHDQQPLRRAVRRAAARRRVEPDAARDGSGGIDPGPSPRTSS